MCKRRLRFSLLIGLVAAACGGGSPTDPGTPTPPGTPVTGVVFYDVNGNGLLDATEVVRLPGVTVSIGGHAATSGTGGRFTVDGVAAGAQQATLRPESLPAYFTAGTPVGVTAPQTGGDVAVPAVLAIGARARPSVYLAFGDSITWGEGSSDGGGYRDFLDVQLRAYWGAGDTINDGIPGTKSNRGESRIASSLVALPPGVRADPVRHERLERRGVPEQPRPATRSTHCARSSCRPATAARCRSSARSRR